MALFLKKKKHLETQIPNQIRRTMLYWAQLYNLKTCSETARHQSLNVAEQQRLRCLPPPPPSGSRSARPQIRYLCSSCVFSSARHMFTSHIHLSSAERWLEFGTDSEAAPPSPPPPPFNTQHSLPHRNTFHPPLVKRIPICPGAKFQPCFLGM